MRDGLWFLPGVLTLGAAALAFVVVQVDRSPWIQPLLERNWIFGGGAEGARGVLNAIAGGLITVTGVVFSVTIVALQLASSQFTPRVLRNFTADRGNQLVLGVFIATFTFSLLVLRTVRSAADGEEPFVPRLGVTLAVVLVLVSIGFLIFFINHSARSIQVAAILERVARRTLGDIDRLFPEQIGREDEGEPPDPRHRGIDAVPVPSAAAGYLQAVDADALFRLGKRQRLVIAMEPYIGDFILPGHPLATVSRSGQVDEQVADGIRQAFVLGPERTPEQDVEFGIVEISDIAIKALSPGINDPTTAIRCIDRLTEVLLALGTRRPPRDTRTEAGNVHFIARHTTFPRSLGLAFDQIRHYGGSNPTIAVRLLQALDSLAEGVAAPRRPVVDAHFDAVVKEGRARISNPVDQETFEEAVQRLRP